MQAVNTHCFFPARWDFLGTHQNFPLETCWGCLHFEALPGEGDRNIIAGIWGPPPSSETPASLGAMSLVPEKTAKATADMEPASLDWGLSLHGKCVEH